MVSPGIASASAPPLLRTTDTRREHVPVDTFELLLADEVEEARELNAVRVEVDCPALWPVAFPDRPADDVDGPDSDAKHDALEEEAA